MPKTAKTDKDTAARTYLEREILRFTTAGSVDDGKSTLIGREEREQKNTHKAVCIWFTGLSGSGKSTLAKELEKRLYEEGKQLFSEGVQVFRLDGDNVRHGLCADLGFSPEDRRKNIRSVGQAVCAGALPGRRGNRHPHRRKERGGLGGGNLPAAPGQTVAGPPSAMSRLRRWVPRRR